MAYATLNDVITYFRPLQTSEVEKVQIMLNDLSEVLRVKAHEYGKDIDQMIAMEPGYATTVKIVLCGIIGRVLRQDVDGEPMSQYSQSALGYSVSGSPVMAGGGAASAILKNDLKALGFKRQRYGGIELYDKHD